MVGWALEHEDLFLKAYEVAKAEPSGDNPRWFSANRIEFPSSKRIKKNKFARHNRFTKPDNPRTEAPCEFKDSLRQTHPAVNGEEIKDSM